MNIFEKMNGSEPQKAKKKTKKTSGSPAQKKREEKRIKEQEAFGIHSGFLCVDCIAKYQSSERKSERYLFFTGIESLQHNREV